MLKRNITGRCGLYSHNQKYWEWDALIRLYILKMKILDVFWGGCGGFIPENFESQVFCENFGIWPPNFSRDQNQKHKEEIKFYIDPENFMKKIKNMQKLLHIYF